MAAPDPLAGSPGEFTANHWKERVGAFHPGGGDHFSGDGDAEASLVGDVDKTRLKGAVRFCLGYQTLETTANYKLLRTLPIRHPEYQELVCVGISPHPFAPPGLDVDPQTLSRLKTYVPSAPTVPTFGAYTTYKKARVVLHFRAADWDTVDDTNIPIYPNPAPMGVNWPAEWTRFTTIDPEPRIEQFGIPGSSMVFAEGTGGVSPVTNPLGQKLAIEIGQLLVKSDLTVTTHRLPHDFLFPANSYFPRNIMKCLGKVNRYAMFGPVSPADHRYEAGTLLHVGTKLVRRRWHLRLGTEAGLLWSMTNLFSFFDPTKGGTGNPSVQITTNRGHNNQIWLGGRDAAGNPLAADTNAMKWFLATRTGDPADKALIETFDLNQLWRSVKAPLDV